MTTEETTAGAAPAESAVASQETTTPASSAAEPAPAQEKTEPSQPAAETQEAGQGEQEEKARPKSRVQERISQLTAQKYALLAENEALRRELERLRQPLASPNDPNLSLEEQEALRLRQVVREERADELEAEIKRRELQAAQIRAQMLNEKIDAAAERIPDLRQKIFDPSLPISTFAVDFIAESDRGAEVAYYLASNPAEARRIYALPATQQAIELARIEARIQVGSQVRKVSQAPPPPPTVGGGSSPGPKDPADMTQEEYNEWYRQRMKGRR